MDFKAYQRTPSTVKDILPKFSEAPELPGELAYEATTLNKVQEEIDFAQERIKDLQKKQAIAAQAIFNVAHSPGQVVVFRQGNNFVAVEDMDTERVKKPSSDEQLAAVFACVRKFVDKEAAALVQDKFTKWVAKNTTTVTEHAERITLFPPTKANL